MICFVHLVTLLNSRGVAYILLVYQIDNKQFIRSKQIDFCVKIVTDLSNLNLNGSISKGTLVPLLLDCGHPICNKCINIKCVNLNKCPKCDKIVKNCKSLLPLNLYALGLIISSYHRPLENDEEFLFCHKLSSQLRQIAKKGQRTQHT